jgi:hypothetical protein
MGANDAYSCVGTVSNDAALSIDMFCRGTENDPVDPTGMSIDMSDAGHANGDIAAADGPHPPQLI